MSTSQPFCKGSGDLQNSSLGQMVETLVCLLNLFHVHPGSHLFLSPIPSRIENTYYRSCQNLHIHVKALLLLFVVALGVWTSLDTVPIVSLFPSLARKLEYC